MTNNWAPFDLKGAATLAKKNEAIEKSEAFYFAMRRIHGGLPRACQKTLIREEKEALCQSHGVDTRPWRRQELPPPPPSENDWQVKTNQRQQRTASACQTSVQALVREYKTGPPKITRQKPWLTGGTINVNGLNRDKIDATSEYMTAKNVVTEIDLTPNNPLCDMKLRHPVQGYPGGRKRPCQGVADGCTKCRQGHRACGMRRL